MICFYHRGRAGASAIAANGAQAHLKCQNLQRKSQIGNPPRLRAYASAITAMDTLKPGMRTGNFAPCRAGGFTGNHFIHSSFIPAKSVSSSRMTVALTTRSSEVPAALRMADTFSRHCLVCSWIVSPTIFPVTGSCGPVPETNTRPAALTAWLYAGGGDGASGVRMMSLAIIFFGANWTTREAIARQMLHHCAAVPIGERTSPKVENLGAVHSTGE